MTRNPKALPDEELERLSAYLDGRLPQEEAARLEARLKTDKDLGRALEELRFTVRLLHSLPQVKAPRNFTLTPQSAGQASRRWAYPVLRFGTAVATLAFLVVTGFGFLMMGAGMASAPAMSLARDLAQEAPAPAPAVEPPLMESAGEAVLPTEAPAPEEAAPPSALFNEAGPSAPAETAAAGVATLTPFCDECEARASTVATSPPLGAAAQPSTPPALEPCPCSAYGPDEATAAEGIEDRELKAVNTAEPPGAEVSETVAQGALTSPIFLWVVLDVILGVAAILLAVFTLRMRRRNR